MGVDTSSDMSSGPQPAARHRAARRRRFQNLRTIGALILREVSSTYGRSPGGYVWAVLEPLGMIALISIGFALVLRAPSLGTSFLLFYATGLLPFRMYQECQAVTAGALRYSKALLVYPVVSFVDALLARAILAGLTQLMVSVVILSGAVLWLDLRLLIDPGPILAAFSMALLLGFGVGTLNALLFDLYPVWKSIFTTLSRPLLLMSAVVYLYEDMPPVAQTLLWWNPLVHVTGLARSGFFSYYRPDYIAPGFVCALALGALSLGLLLLRRHYRKVLAI